jgi:hypothetical protein
MFLQYLVFLPAFVAFSSAKYKSSRKIHSYHAIAMSNENFPIEEWENEEREIFQQNQVRFK